MQNEAMFIFSFFVIGDVEATARGKQFGRA